MDQYKANVLEWLKAWSISQEITYDDYLKGFVKTQTEENVPPVTKKICLGCDVAICSVCMVCHSTTCNFVDKQVITEEQRFQYKNLECRTQKARGMITLDNMGLQTLQPRIIVQSVDDAKYAAQQVLRVLLNNPKVFVRPCPMRPRHGFVESAVLEADSHSSSNDIEAQLVKTLTAANAADEAGKAELMLLPYVEATHNMIITPSRMVIGPNHDGATAGYDSIEIPLVTSAFGEVDSDLLRKGGIGESDDPYFEVVAKTSKGEGPSYFTQMRAGAKLPSGIGADYVPDKVRVKQIVEAAGDLLEWESQVKEFKPGTVVVKLGGSLLSHYGVHCLYNKVPCFTSRIPEVGEVLEPVGESPTPDLDSVVEGLAYGALVPINWANKDGFKPRPLLIAMMTALHNAGVMSGRHGFWLGYGAATMLRFGMAASHGEARHKLTNMSHKRSYVYGLAFEDFKGARNTLGTAQWMFTKLKWSGAFGGKAWANCTEAVIKLDEAIRKVLKLKSQPDLLEGESTAISEMVGALNVAINQAHNGGWWLNKFIMQGAFDEAAGQFLSSLAAAGPVMFDLKQMTLDRTKIDDLISWWTAAEDITVNEGVLQVQQVNGGVIDKNHMASEDDGSDDDPCDDEDFEPEPCSEDDTCTCSHCLMVKKQKQLEADMVGVNIPVNAMVMGGPDSWPPLKLKGIPPHHSNLNSGLDPAKIGTGEILAAQMNFTKYGKDENGKQAWLAHMQYKPAKAQHLVPGGGYLSMSSIPLLLSEEISAKLLKGSVNPQVSWSGSGILNYWKLELTEIQGPMIWVFDNSELDAEIGFEPSGNILTIGGNSVKQTEEQQVVETTKQLDEIPF